MRRAVISLMLLAVGVLAIFAGAAGGLFSWGFTTMGLVMLARVARWKRAAIGGMITLATSVLIGLAGTGLSVGLWGRPLFGLEGRAPDFANLLVAAGPLASCVTLALRTPDASTQTSRRLALGALGVVGVFVLVLLAVIKGERIAGLLGILGAIALLLTAAALAAGIMHARRATA